LFTEGNCRLADKSDRDSECIDELAQGDYDQNDLQNPMQLTATIFELVCAGLLMRRAIPQADVPF
jgi:hypothetical protein